MPPNIPMEGWTFSVLSAADVRGEYPLLSEDPIQLAAGSKICDLIFSGGFGVGKRR